MNALKQEVVGFSFENPYEVDLRGVLPGSLRYPIFSDKLTWSAMRMDADGIPRAWSRITGTQYWPGYIAWYSLVELNLYERNGKTHHLESFIRQVDWLARNSAALNQSTVCWQAHFAYPEDGIVLRPPWVSAFAQGLAISALVRGYRQTRRPELLDLATRAVGLFALDVERGGICARTRDCAFYTEVPGGSLPGILDGFLVSLVGLHDAYVETGEPRAGRLFEQGIAGLQKLLTWWNYRDKWSWYGCRLHLCTPAYHYWNTALLSVLGRITQATDLIETASRWSGANLSQLDRAEIYSVFLCTKNMTRARKRTWRQKSLS